MGRWEHASSNPDIAEEGCQAIRQSLVEMYGNEIGEQVRILYGGSVNPENIGQIMSKPNVDGALIGRQVSRLKASYK